MSPPPSFNRTFFTNLEWRFPLVDRMDLAFLRLGGIRGRIFIDVGAAWYVDKDGNEFNMFGEPGFTFMEDWTLVDGVSSYGFGIDIKDRHRAAADALATCRLLLLLFSYLAERGITTLEEVLLFQYGEYDYQQ